MKKIYEKYKELLPLGIYMVVYLLWFAWLEQRTGVKYRIIHMNVDDYIPFCEAFVIPYFLWYAYVVVVVLYLYHKDRENYHRNVVFLCIGMTLFLLISTLFPNGHHLRLRQMPRDNVFTAMITALWKTDTATNLWPSIHVYNSLGAHFGVISCERLSRNKWINRGSAILCASIILSTMFIKQHSMFDVLTAFITAAVAYSAVYVYDIIAVTRGRKAAKRRRVRRLS